jgi:excisionase family DNA binding protein
MNEQNGVKETYLTIEEVAAYLKLAQPTIRKYVLNKTIPYRKVQKLVRFRLSEIEKWIDKGEGIHLEHKAGCSREGDLFAGVEVETEADREAGEIKA